MTPVINQNKVPMAREIMRDAFDTDSGPRGFRYSYIANIAMLLYDNTNLDIKVCNNLAGKLLKLIFY